LRKKGSRAHFTDRETAKGVKRTSKREVPGGREITYVIKFEGETDRQKSSLQRDKVATQKEVTQRRDAKKRSLSFSQQRPGAERPSTKKKIQGRGNCG